MPVRLRSLRVRADTYLCNAPARFDARRVTVEHARTNTHFEDGRWIRTRELVQSPVNDAIEELTYDYLDETGVDWYNNDGGYGELIVDVQNDPR